MNLNDIKDLIPNATAGYFATTDEFNNPDVRGWSIQAIEDDKVYFITSNKKKVYNQIQRNPNVAFLCNANGYSFRVYGKVHNISDLEVINRLHQNAAINVKNTYPTIDSNGFTVICMEHGKIACSKGFAPAEIILF